MTGLSCIGFGAIWNGWQSLKENFTIFATIVAQQWSAPGVWPPERKMGENDGLKPGVAG